jgi:hypothetical protein
MLRGDVSLNSMRSAKQSIAPRRRAAALSIVHHDSHDSLEHVHATSLNTQSIRRDC